MSEPAIVPRWEWRTFGDDFPIADRELDALTADLVNESDELYLLSALGNASIKVRAGLMDVKRLETVEDGLELWLPVLKAAFPLSAADVGAVLEALRIAPVDLPRDAYTLEEFEADLVDPNPDLLVVRVHKRRAHFTVDDCLVERTEITADDRSTRTIAAESPDPALVLSTVRRLGLAQRRNVNVARGLKSLVGFGATAFAVIDVGTNSIKFHIGARQADGTWQTVVDRSAVTRLGEGLAETGRLSEGAIDRSVEAITAMSDEAREHNVSALVAVGTAGLRMAANGSAFVDDVRTRSGVSIEIISGEEEGRLAYVAATSALPMVAGELVVFDSGGGSSQFTFGRGNQVDERFSVNVGAVRFAERFGLAGVVSADRIQEALAAIAADLERLDGRTAPDAIVGMGGTATNLAAVKHELASYDARIVHGTVLDIVEIDRQIEMFRTHDLDARRNIAGLQPQRAEVILAGACIVRTIVAKLGRASFTVCDLGLRHGLLHESFAQPAETPPSA